MTEFTIYPAIDLRKGKVVRLKKGDPAAQTIYGDNAAQTAETWISTGAKWLHIVNLDGAFGKDTEANWTAVNAVLNTCDDRAAVQLGGGIRDLSAIRQALAIGIDRVVLGTAAIENEEFAAEALEKFGPDQIAFALDAKKGELMTRGWKTGSGQSTIEFANHLAALGAKILIYTNIDTDGMGIGNDFETARQIVGTTGLQVIASGGIASISDVKKVKKAGLSGLIIGRALYEKQITLEEALAC
ncbi:MAG: 1-(5-phosphoribosyl)-5-[(5-phosphoribosylamino)methylideneamino]imidazole-4-carboxamide isomerase [Chloroflexi bacterium]|nr:1-(5-phosphoribosyl)-5-[(5-phosphoribosylamino)methylideneamino]imidazole-4-carboxamide isomerase [Chloroflexota bacterium]